MNNIKGNNNLVRYHVEMLYYLTCIINRKLNGNVLMRLSPSKLTSLMFLGNRVMNVSSMLTATYCCIIYSHRNNVVNNNNSNVNQLINNILQ